MKKSGINEEPKLNNIDRFPAIASTFNLIPKKSWLLYGSEK